MRKIGIGNFQLPAGKENAANSGRLLPHHELSELRSITSGNVMKIAMRAVERAEKYDCKHPFWNSLADCYVRIVHRIKSLNDMFPGIKRIIHNSEVKKGDMLVSDFYTGLNFGFMNGGTEPVKIRVLEVDGELLKGMVLRSNYDESKEIGYFKNELWFFISHRFTIYTSGKGSKNQINK
jgi:hypothetical protein